MHSRNHQDAVFEHPGAIKKVLWTYLLNTSSFEIFGELYRALLV